MMGCGTGCRAVLAGGGAPGAASERRWLIEEELLQHDNIMESSSFKSISATTEVGGHGRGGRGGSFAWITLIRWLEFQRLLNVQVALLRRGRYANTA